MAGYNVQVAVDAKHKLLVVAEATQDGNDMHQLAPMAQAAQATLAVDLLTVTADSGYFNVQGIQTCEAAHITPYVPEPHKTNQAPLQGRFGREAFQFDAAADGYRCPAGQSLKHYYDQTKAGKTFWHYTSEASRCAACPLRGQCLAPKSRTRRICRWEHETVIDAHRARMAQAGRAMLKTRSALVEHPFGTLKLWCGWRHFLMRGLEKVQAELSLLMLSYNFKRVFSILGLDAWRTYCLQRRSQSPCPG